jgi:uncharacterized protein YjaZ
MDLIESFKHDVIDHFNKTDLRKELVTKKEFDATLIEKFKNEFKKIIKDFSYKHTEYNIKDFGSLDELNASKIITSKNTPTKKDVHIVITNKKLMKKEQRKQKTKK